MTGKLRLFFIAIGLACSAALTAQVTSLLSPRNSFQTAGMTSGVSSDEETPDPAVITRRFLRLETKLQVHPVQPIQSEELNDVCSKLLRARTNALNVLNNIDVDDPNGSDLRKAELLVNQFDALMKQREGMIEQLPCTVPCSGRNASDFGGRFHPILRRYKMHTGQDIAAPSGTPIRAANDGVVSFAGSKGGYGNCVMLSHGMGYQTLYGHCSAYMVKPGQHVKSGEIIALVGSSGLATGPHLHYEVWLDSTRIDPRDFLGNSWATCSESNGTANSKNACIEVE